MGNATTSQTGERPRDCSPSNRRQTARSPRAARWGCVTTILLALAPASAPAQVIRAFTPRFTVNDVGDVYVIGNTSMSCDIADVDCANARNRVGALLNNNNFVMEYVDVDGDVSTFSSSSADFTVPSGGTVLFAGLYWGGRSTDANRYSVQLATPTSGGYVSLTATQQDIDAAGQRYSGFIDVTALVQAGGTGTYAVANVLGQPGQTNRYAGWSLVVVVRDPSATIRSMAVFDGYAEVTTTTPSVNIPVTGLLTPPTGPVNTRMGAVAYEGDLNLTGDELQLNGVTVGDAESPATNFFNSSISRLGVPLSSKNPDYLNQLSFDADIVDVTPFGAIGNGATSATITLTTSGDFYWPAAVTFVTDLFEPVIQPNFLKTVTDINGGVVQPGDILEYALALENSGNDAALVATSCSSTA